MLGFLFVDGSMLCISFEKIGVVNSIIFFVYILEDFIYLVKEFVVCGGFWNCIISLGG